MIPEDVKINPAKKEKRRKVVTENMIRAGIFFQPNAVSQRLSVDLWTHPPPPLVSYSQHGGGGDR